MKFISHIFPFFCFLLSAVYAEAAGTYAAHSALASGRWVKIQVAENGVYKLTDAQLQNMGFSDPSKVSIHGYGGWMLSETLDGSAPDDLPTIPIYRGDGYILFYGKGTVKWTYGTADGEAAFVHENKTERRRSCTRTIRTLRLGITSLPMPPRPKRWRRKPRQKAQCG